MALDSQAREFIDNALAEGFRPLHELTPQEAREGLAATVAERPRGEEVTEVIDRRIPGPAGEIPIRIYIPEAKRPLPVFVWLHGGAFIMGDLDYGDCECRAMANGSGCLLISVDYRLAPEHKFPAAVEDCAAAVEWASANAATLGGEPSRLAIGGESAGGNLAAVTCLVARDRGGPPIAFQLLVYPAVDLANFDYRSYRELATGYLIETADAEWILSHYSRTNDDRFNPYVSPIVAEDLSGLPPAHVITAEYDILRDQGEAYAKRLEAAGVPATVTRYDGTIHAFFVNSHILDAGRRAVEEACDVLRDALAAPSTGRGDKDGVTG